MKLKGFTGILLAVLCMGSAAAADTYVSSSDDAGFVITADKEIKIKAVVADYDGDGRLLGAATRLVDAVAGDNSYAYEDFGAEQTDAERRIFLWKGEENSIEPINGLPQETEAPNEYAEVMAAAVENGLIDEGVLDSRASITGEQVMQIMTRAMGDFEPEVDFSSQTSVTCAQAYELAAKTFDFDSYYITYASGKRKYVGRADEACLDVFEDKDTVSSALLEYAEAVVGNGGFGGFDGKLKGDSAITVGEFAYLMDSLIGTYIDEPGTYTAADIDAAKSVIVRSGGVVIDGLETDRNLIIAYSVDTNGTVIMNSTVTGVTSIMGGANPGSEEAGILLHGTFTDVRVNSPYIMVNASGAKMDYCRIAKDSVLNMGGF